jgi:SSS family solute:Na+ symporter
MQPLDWIIVIGSLLLVLGTGVYAQTFMKSVADFMSAGRVARRYLLAVSRGEMQASAVMIVGGFEAINHSGVAYYWWSWLPEPIMLAIAVFGFVIYRYRETRALTLGQFFEIRYSRKFRLFAGFLGFFAGLLNFGIVPVIGARVMVYFLDLPMLVHPCGVAIPTYVLLMGMFLLVNLAVTLGGGLITLMTTSCVEGIITQLLYLVLIFCMLGMFSWSQFAATLGDRPTGHSYLNPMDSLQVQDFNIWLVLMGIAGSLYGTMAWQNQSAYNSAPLTAHEGVMGGLLIRWRNLGQAAVMTLLCVGAMTYLHDPQYAAGAAQVHAELAKITHAQTREQMEIPITIAHLLPMGVKGALCVILLLGIFGGDATHLHSWGSLFIQDVLLPLRQKPFTPVQHIWLLRLAIAGVALFVFFFGIYFPQSDYIYMWFAVTQSLFIGGAGSVIIGGLYWKKGTTAGAWTGLLTGFVLSLAGIAAQEIYGREFTLNGMQIFFFTMLASVGSYVAASMFTYREDFNMDRMLHRGAYARIAAAVGDQVEVAAGPKSKWGALIGYNANFTTGDKWIAGTQFAWVISFFAIMVVGTIWNLIQPWPLSVWSGFWFIVAIVIPVIVSIVTGVWFTWGGIVDMLDFFRRLRTEKVNPYDSGFVVAHQNLDESRLPESSDPKI